MTEPEEGARFSPSLTLDERVFSTLRALHGRIAFSGLRRVLHAHPESLSRSLRRLEREGRVERTAGGYRAVERRSTDSPGTSSDLRPIAQVDLPPGVLPETVLGRLANRWFGSLRWVGIVHGPTGQLLAWARRDGAGYVVLGIHERVLRVYLRDESTEDDENEAEDAAYELLEHAVNAVRLSDRALPGSVTYFARGTAGDALPVDN